MFYAGMAYAVGKFASGRVGICRLYWFLALFRPFDSLGRFAMGWRFYCFSRFLCRFIILLVFDASGLRLFEVRLMQVCMVFSHIGLVVTGLQVYCL